MTSPAQQAQRRRKFLLRGASLGMAGLLPLALDDDANGPSWRGEAGGIGGARVPPTTVSLADYGGAPGATAATLIRAFGRALAALSRAAGGTLVVPAGVYDFGAHAQANTIILCRDLRDIAISAYGAMFMATTTANVMPTLFYFFNFRNITIAGARFTDRGFSPWVDWRGMYCAGIQADRASSGFTMVDCHAERVTGLLAAHNHAGQRALMSNICVQAAVHDAYYGVGASFIRENIRVELDCHNVRRAFIAAALKNAEIVIRADSTSQWPGSNGLVALIAPGSSMGDVENVRVRVDVSGACRYAGVVHFYHQGPEKQGRMRHIDATVNLFNIESGASLFVFDHEVDRVNPTTPRIWDQIALHGAIVGRFPGRVVANPSRSSAPGTIYLDPALARRQDPAHLGAGFRIHPAPRRPHLAGRAGPDTGTPSSCAC